MMASRPLGRRSALIGAAAAALAATLSPRTRAQPRPSSQPGEPAPSTLAERGFQDLALDMVRTGQCDGLAIVTVKDGLATYCTAGHAVRGSLSPVSKRHVFEIGSISKVLSAQVLAHAVVAGRIELQADIRSVLPGHFQNLAFEGQPIRVQHLVDTTSALPDNLPESQDLLRAHPPEAHAEVIARQVARHTPAQLLSDLASATLHRPAGRRPAHSNVAAQLLGIILGRLYGQPYASLLNRFVERPWGMTPSDRTRRAMDTTGYASPTGAAAPWLQGETFEAAGGLAYSAQDLGRCLNGLLSSKGPATAMTRHVLWGDVSATALGFGWRVSMTPDGLLRYRASGGTLGYSSHIEFYPELGYGVALLANRAGEAQGHLKWMAERGKDRLFGKPAALLAFEQGVQASAFSRVAEVADVVKRRYPTFHLAQDLVDTWAFGLIFEGQKSEGLALLAFQAASQPRSVEALTSYAEGSAAVGQCEQALALFAQALALEPDNAQAAQRIIDLRGPR